MLRGIPQQRMVKVFIVCGPQGVVIYLSTAWGGRASDVEMVRASDIMTPKNHQPRDQLLADRGFTLVEERVVSCRAESLIPIFTKGKKTALAQRCRSVTQYLYDSHSH